MIVDPQVDVEGQDRPVPQQEIDAPEKEAVHAAAVHRFQDSIDVRGRPG
jgi:hypothetical protein